MPLPLSRDQKIVYARASDPSPPALSSVAPESSVLALPPELHAAARLAPTLPPISIWDVVAIESGPTKNGAFYRPEVLADAIPLLENAPVAQFSFEFPVGPGHRHMPERFRYSAPELLSGNVIGVLKSAWMQDLPSSRDGDLAPCLCAKLAVLDPALDALMIRAEMVDALDLLELSIDVDAPDEPRWFGGKWGGRTYRDIKKILAFLEITIVRDAAAGGRFLRKVAGPDGRDEWLESLDPAARARIVDFLDAKSRARSRPLFSPSSSSRPQVEPACPAEAPLAPEDPGLRKEHTVNVRATLIKAARALGHRESLEAVENAGVQAIVAEKLASRQGEAGDLGELIRKAQSALTEGRADDAMTALDMMAEMMAESERTEKAEDPQQEADPAPAPAPALPVPASVPAHACGSCPMAAGSAPAPQPSVQSEAIRVAEHARATAESERRARESEHRTRLIQCEMVLDRALEKERNHLPESYLADVRRRYANRAFDPADLARDVEAERKKFEESTGLATTAANSRQAEGYRACPSVRIGASRRDYLLAEARCLFNPDIERIGQQEGWSEEVRGVHREASRRRPSLKRLIFEWHDVNRYEDVKDGRYGPNSLARLGMRQAEANLTTSLPRALQDSARMALVDTFRKEEQPWTDIAEPVDVESFEQYHFVLMGGMGWLPSVAEGTTYPTIGFVSDAEITATPTKKGGHLAITDEMILADKIDALRNIPGELGNRAARTLNRTAFEALIALSAGTIGAANSYDAVAVYSTVHANLVTTTMSYASLTAMRKRLRETHRFAQFFRMKEVFTGVGAVTQHLEETDGTAITDLANRLTAGDLLEIGGEVMRIATVGVGAADEFTVVAAGRGLYATTAAAHADETRVKQRAGRIGGLNDLKVVTVPNKETDLLSILQSQGVYGSGNPDQVNLLREAKDVKALVVDDDYLYNHAYNYYMVAGKPVRVLFVEGVREPTIRLADNPLVGARWDNDQLEWKVYHPYAAAVPDHLYVQGAIGATA